MSDASPLDRSGTAVSDLTSEPTGSAAMLHLGTRRELFVDRHLIDRLEGAELALHRPVPRGVVFRFDQAWEGAYCGYCTVLEDGDRYRLYYRAWPALDAPAYTCLAESDDGVAWSRPVVRRDAAAPPNAVIDDPELTHNVHPFIDLNPGAAADQRYRAVASDDGLPEGRRRMALFALASSDGRSWRRLAPGPVFDRGAFDSQNVAFWSELEGRYVCVYRIYDAATPPAYREIKGLRTFARITSEDLIHWSDPAPADFGGAARENLYTNQTFPYPRAPHIYISFATRFMRNRRALSVEEIRGTGLTDPDKGADDCSDAVLLSSRGDARFDRTFMESFIRPGLGAEHWTTRTNYPAHGLLMTGRDEMSIYVQRRYGQRGHHLERFTMRPDGFASLRGPYRGGEMTTRPLTFEGTTLYLNYSTSVAGSIRVEVQDAGGAPLPGLALDDCAAIFGDRLEAPVRWKEATLGTVAGTPVRLRFVLKDADVFSLRFGNAQEA